MKMENAETFQSNLNSALSYLKSHKNITDASETAFLELASSVQLKVKDNLSKLKLVTDKINDQLNMCELRVQTIVRNYELMLRTFEKQ